MPYGICSYYTSNAGSKKTTYGDPEFSIFSVLANSPAYGLSINTNPSSFQLGSAPYLVLSGTPAYSSVLNTQAICGQYGACSIELSTNAIGCVPPPPYNSPFNIKACGNLQPTANAPCILATLPNNGVNNLNAGGLTYQQVLNTAYTPEGSYLLCGYAYLPNPFVNTANTGVISPFTGAANLTCSPVNPSYTGTYSSQLYSLTKIADQNVPALPGAKTVGTLTGFQTADPAYTCLNGGDLNVYTASAYPNEYLASNYGQSGQCAQLTLTFQVPSPPPTTTIGSSQCLLTPYTVPPTIFAPVISIAYYTYNGIYSGQTYTLSKIPNQNPSGAVLGTLVNFQTNDPAYSCLNGQSLNVYSNQQGYQGYYFVSTAPTSMCTVATFTFAPQLALSTSLSNTICAVYAPINNIFLVLALAIMMIGAVLYALSSMFPASAQGRIKSYGMGLVLVGVISTVLVVVAIFVISLAANTSQAAVLGACKTASASPPPPPPPPPQTYTLTTAVSGTGTISPAAGTHTTTPGTPTSISETPGAGYTFTGWTCTGPDAGSCPSGSGTTSFSLPTTGSDQVTADFATSPPPPPAPTLTAINPNTGDSSGPVSITSVTGTNFVSGATISLTMTGQPTIACTGFTYTSSTQLSSGTCPITGATPGAWNVVVTNPGGQTGTLTSGFTITSAWTYRSVYTFGSGTSLTLAAGYPSYFCLARGGSSIRSVSWTADARGAYTSVGHQTSNICSFTVSSVDSALYLGGIGVDSAYTLEAAKYGATSIALSYSISNPSGLVFLLFTTGGSTLSVSLPAGCTRLSTASPLLVMADCAGQSGPYSVYATSSPGGYGIVGAAYST
jgi:hypothetical protein